MHFLLAFGSRNFKLCICIGHMMLNLLGNIYCDPKVKVKCQIMFFLVIASPKLLDLADSNFSSS